MEKTNISSKISKKPETRVNQIESVYIISGVADEQLHSEVYAAIIPVGQLLRGFLGNSPRCENHSWVMLQAKNTGCCI
jgi:hypothetical protein